MVPQEQTPLDCRSSVSSKSSDRRIPTLDGWRAIAIALVLFNHIGMVLTRSDAPSLLYAGSMGVSLFFGLSGLLITTLLLREWDRNDRINWRAFYERRLFRIVPAYLAFLLAVSLAGGWQSGWEALATVFFARNYLPKNLASPLTGHLWSLAVEMHFYLLWPLILRWAGRRRAATVAAYLALACIGWRHVELVRGPLAHRLPDMVLAFRTDLRLDALLWGCVLAFSLHNARERDKLRHQLGITTTIVLAVVGALCGAVENTIGQAFTALLLPVVISATVLHPHWAFSRLLETAPLRWIGRLSYSLYLWQQVMFIATSLTPIHTSVPLPLLLAFTAALAIGCHYGIEQPVLAWSHRRRRRNTSATCQPVPLTVATKTASAG